LTVINPRHWSRQRLRYLQEALDGGVSAGQAAAIEGEMTQLRRPAGFLTDSGMRRWLRRVGPPPSESSEGGSGPESG
jgi:hypothetical protein